MTRAYFILPFLLASAFAHAQTEPGIVYKKHVVKASETVYGIATRTYKITPEDLYKANPELRKSGLKEGMTINIPVAQPATTAEKTEEISPPAETKTTEGIPSVVMHTVKEGEDYDIIANQYGITTEELKAATNPHVLAHDLVPGQQLIVPAKAKKSEPVKAKPISTEPTPTLSANDEWIHIVKPGETIYNIAVVQHGITVNQLMAANPSLGSKMTLTPGQQLRIPGGPAKKTEVVSSVPPPQTPSGQKTETPSTPEVPVRLIQAKDKARSTGVIAGTVIRKPITTTQPTAPAETTSTTTSTYKETRVEPKITVTDVVSEKTEVKVVKADTTITDALPKKKKKKKKRSAAIYDPHFNGIDNRNFPSRLGEGFEKAELNIINLHGWVSNTSISYGAVRDMLFGDEITEAQVKNIVSKMRTRNQLFVGADLQTINVGFKIFRKVKKKKVELLSLELGHRERVTANLQYNKNLFKVALEGNKQFAGQDVSLGPVRGNALYVREFPLGVAVPFNLKLPSHAIQLRPAMRFKFLMGIGNVYTKRGNANMYTDPEGKFIDFDFDYLVHTSIPNSLKGLSGAGNLGWGLDFGMGVNVNDNLSFDLGVIDVGGVRFKNNVTNYSRTGTYRYDGAEANLFTDDNGDKGVGFSINEKLFDPDETNTAYTTPFGPKITMRAEYRLGKSRWGLRRDSTRRYFQHHLSFTYIQGLQNAYNATTIPAFSIGYMYSLKNILNLGLNMGFLGYNKFSIGPFVSVKGGPFVLGFGSDNLMPLIAPRAGTGIDAYFKIGLVF